MRQRTATAIGCFFLGLLLAGQSSTGCGPSTPPPASPDAGSCEPFVTGTVDDDGGFTPLVENQDLTVFRGAQGGFHVFVGARSNAPKQGMLEWSLRTPEGMALAARALDVSAIRLEDTECGWLRVRDLLVFDRNEDVPTVRGKPVQLTGKLGALEKTVTVVPR